MAKGKFKTACQRWAGVGPYYAMFPTTFADEVVRQHCPEGGTVLDPFSGRGTALFSAASSGRHALGVELNPVGWVYSKAKLAPAHRDDVENRASTIQSLTPHFRRQASELPAFFRHCFSREVQYFLLSARAHLDWRRNHVDRTLMAFLLVHLHGKYTDSLSNQMRQTKAMAPQYAIRWWKERGFSPPKIDVLDFLQKKLAWRYAKGLPVTSSSRVYLGDSIIKLPQLRGGLRKAGLPKASLLLTSPPYFGVTNYHYDQWLRLWLLGGPPTDRRSATRFRGKHRGKFENGKNYKSLLEGVFSAAVPLLRKDAVVYVRTDSRELTLSATVEALKTAFPAYDLRRRRRPLSGVTQTRLFGNGDPRVGEIDLILTPKSSGTTSSV